MIRLGPAPARFFGMQRPQLIPQKWWLTRCSWRRPPRARGDAIPPARLRGRSGVLRRFAPAEMFDKSLRKQMRLPV
jgi:hypothetical protein